MSDNQHDSLLGKIAAYTEILSTDPRSTIFVSLSEAYRKMGMLDDAHGVAVKGLASLPDYGPGYVVLARIKCQQNALSESEEAFTKALEIDPDSLAALVGFSRLCLLQEKQAEARNLLLRARDLSPADPVINKLLLTIPEPVAVPEPVLEPIADEIEVPEDLPEPEQLTAPPELRSVAEPEPLESATLAELYLKQGMPDKALNIFHNLLSRDPDNLALRRRIRDLESGAEEPATTAGRPESVAVLPETADSQAPVANSELVLPEMSVLDQFNRLLTSIQKRRGDV